MNNPRTIRTVVISVPVEDVDTHPSNRLARSSRFRPSDLLPWSDPYIASLVRKLQQEVRDEQQPASGRLASEAEMPWNEPFEQFEEEQPSFAIDPDNLLRW
jgi:hypothetical protein